MSVDNTTPPAPDPTEPLPDELADEIEAQDHEFSLEDLAAHFNDPADTDADADADGEDDPEDPDPAETPAPDLETEELDPAAKESGISREESEPAAIQQPDPAAADPAPEVTELAPTSDLVQFNGATYRKADVEAVVAWVESLTPEQLAALNNPAAATPPGATPPESQSESTTDALPEEVVDPQLAEWTARQIAAVNERLESFQRAEEQRARQEAQLAEAAFAQAFEEARTETRDRFNLTDTEVDLLLTTASQANAVGFISQQNPNLGPKEMLEAAFEATLWQTPAFRDKAVAAQVAEAVGNVQVDATIAERKANNSSIVGSGAVTPRQQRQKPQTTEDHHQAAVDLVSEAMKTGNQ